MDMKSLEIIEKIKELIAYHENETSLGYETVQNGPPEWRYMPKDAAEGKRAILRSVATGKGFPDFVRDTMRGNISFDCGPINREKINPNGYAHTSGSVGWLEVINAVVDERLRIKHGDMMK